MHAGLTNTGGFPDRIAGFLGGKYGYDPADAAGYTPRVVELLGQCAAVLRAQQAAGKDYYLGDTLSAVDVYSAAFMGLFKPLSQEQCAMSESLRSALEWLISRATWGWRTGRSITTSNPKKRYSSSWSSGGGSWIPTLPLARA